eukprot:SAG22_NODE_16767_length_318_cov_0.926941_1_plen_83_part_10
MPSLGVLDRRAPGPAVQTPGASCIRSRKACSPPQPPRPPPPPLPLPYPSYGSAVNSSRLLGSGGKLIMISDARAKRRRLSLHS